MPVRERILVMGPPGTGKTYQWLRMAKALLPTGAQFYCIDTDDAIPFMLATQFPELQPESGGNVHALPAFDWPEYESALQEVLKKAKEGDWVVLDMADSAWDTVQRYFVNEVFAESKGQYFLEARKLIRARGEKDSKGRAVSALSEDTFKGWIDWPVINALYGDWILPLVYRTKAHLYATTKIQKLGTREDPGTMIVFGASGIRPSGQKHLGHQAHTVLLYTVNVSDAKHPEWTVTTVKDRGNRPYFNKAPFVDLYRQYLVMKAGWEMP